MTNVPLPLPRGCFELRFESLFRPGCALAFPCDSEGRVDDERLGADLRHSYLFARAMVGREYKWPRITQDDAPRIALAGAAAAPPPCAKNRKRMEEGRATPSYAPTDKESP